MDHWPALADLPLVVEELGYGRLDPGPGFGEAHSTRLVRLTGAAHEGLGEDITLFLEPGGPDLALAGEWTLGSFCAHLDTLEQWPGGEPELGDIVRRFRNWAYESAALDLALAQAGRPLEAGQRVPAPGVVELAELVRTARTTGRARVVGADLDDLAVGIEAVELGAAQASIGRHRRLEVRPLDHRLTPPGRHDHVIDRPPRPELAAEPVAEPAPDRVGTAKSALRGAVRVRVAIGEIVHRVGREERSDRVGVARGARIEVVANRALVVNGGHPSLQVLAGQQVADTLDTATSPVKRSLPSRVLSAGRGGRRLRRSPCDPWRRDSNPSSEVEISTGTFDPGAYKRTTTDQWQTAAEPWHRWGPTLEAWLGEATETMFDMAGVTRNAQVLDVAAGAGGQTLAAARRVGPDGHVLATDISSNILVFAERSAREAGLRNVETRVLDGEHLDVEPGAFDAVISRVGFIYFPDQHAAFVGMRRALRPGGRLAGIVYSTPDANPFFSIPVSIIRRRAQLPAPVQGQPGPFSLGAPGVIEAALERAGFTTIEVRRIAAPLRLPSAAEFVRFARESFGALHQMLEGLREAEREEAWSEIERELSRYETAGGFEGPCELLVAAGTAPT